MLNILANDFFSTPEWVEKSRLFRKNGCQPFFSRLYLVYFALLTKEDGRPHSLITRRSPPRWWLARYDVQPSVVYKQPMRITTLARANNRTRIRLLTYLNWYIYQLRGVACYPPCSYDFQCENWELIYSSLATVLRVNPSGSDRRRQGRQRSAAYRRVHTDRERKFYGMKKEALRLARDPRSRHRRRPQAEPQVRPDAPTRGRGHNRGRAQNNRGRGHDRGRGRGRGRSRGRHSNRVLGGSEGPGLHPAPGYEVIIDWGPPTRSQRERWRREEEDDVDLSQDAIEAEWSSTIMPARQPPRNFRPGRGPRWLAH